jgi:hypothetical protein
MMEKAFRHIFYLCAGLLAACAAGLVPSNAAEITVNKKYNSIQLEGKIAKQVLGRFNGFLKSVILRVNEARDLGEFDRYAFHDHMKAYIAAPPDVIHIDEKNIREYYVFNLCGVIITSNHKTDGIYLPADDRRHMVAWSNLTSDDFAADYWRKLYRWYANGGNQHVAAYLAGLDLSDFDPKAPPPKTQAFWEIATPIARPRMPNSPTCLTIWAAPMSSH